MDKPLKVLIVEDSEDDALLTARELKRGGYEPVFERVCTAESMDEAISKRSWDIVIADYSMPHFSGLAALKILQAHKLDTPFILLSGKIGEDKAVEAMRLGANDYIMKNDLARLTPAIERELKEAEIRLQRRQAEEIMVKRDEQLEILSRTSQHINAVLEVPVVLRTLTAAAMELVDGTGATAGLFTDGKMRFTEYNNDGRIESVDYTFGADKAAEECVINARKPCLSNYASSDPRVDPEKRKIFAIYNLVSVPIISGKGELIGCFEIYNKKDKLPFETQDVFMLQGLAASAAIALGNAMMLNELKASEKRLETMNQDLSGANRRLKKMALIDPHTGVYSYRYLEDATEAEFHRAVREGGCFSMIMMDMDYFKSINDVYGHNMGDLVLKQFARRLRRMLRRYDILIRFGGEEFVVISPGIERSGALQLAHRILKIVHLTTFGSKKHPIKLKLSFGVTSYPEDWVSKGMKLFELADAALSKAKSAGGDTVCSSLDLNKNISKPTDEIVSPEVKLLKDKIEKLTMRGNQSIIEAVFAFAKTIELKDRVTGEHVEKVVNYAEDIAKELKLSESDIKRIKEACILHDLGKIGIGDSILNKNGKLTEKEFADIKTHPQIGVDIIRPIKSLRSVMPLILHHHEWWNGSGYPDGLKGEEIPVGARIVAIADVYQALISDRPYRKAYSKAKALEMIKNNAGTQFDPKIVEIFIEIYNKR